MMDLLDWISLQRILALFLAAAGWAFLLNIRLLLSCVFLAIAIGLPVTVRADTYVIPFSEIRQAVDSSGDAPDVVIRAYLAGLIRDELDALGFDADGGLIMSDIPVEEINQIIETDCNFPRPYAVHIGNVAR